MKASIITGVILKKDAVSSSTRRKVQALGDIYGSLNIPLDLQVYTGASDYVLGGLVKKVSSVTEIILDKHFLSSGLIIYDFGIFYELFNSIHLASASAKKIVHYHNITPVELVASYNREYIDMSFIQLVNILKADIVFSGSRFNTEDLIKYGVAEKDIAYLNYVVDFNESSNFDPLNKSRSDTIEALYVGRFVHSKGLVDLLRALKLVIANGVENIHLTLVGSQEHSDPDYVEDLRSQIQNLDLTNHVTIREGISDEERDACYQRSHLFLTASYHEGFCVPVIEALRHGCYVISYDAGNLPFVVNGLGNVVKTGDFERLAWNITRYIDEKSLWKTPGETMLQTDAGIMCEKDFMRKAFEYSLDFSYGEFKKRLYDILEKESLIV